jgi:hypothetical protein
MTFFAFSTLSYHLSVEVQYFKALEINHFFLQFFREENIPAEILARGPEAVEAYHKLRRLGTAPLYRGRVFLVGLDRFEKWFYSCQRQVRKMVLFLSKTGSENGFILVKDRFEKCFCSCRRQVRKMVLFLSKTGSKNAFVLVKDRFEKCFCSCQRQVRKMLLFLSKTGSKNGFILVKDWFEKNFSSKKLQKISEIWFYPFQSPSLPNLFILIFANVKPFSLNLT